MNGFQVVFLFRIEIRIQQNAAQPDNPVQWRTQFVTDGGDKGGFLTAGVFNRFLITLALSDITTKAHQAVAFADTVIERYFAQLKAGFASVRVDQPLLIGERNIMTEHFFIRFHHLISDFRFINIARGQAAQQFFTAAGKQFHRAVTAGKLIFLIAVIHQVRRSIKEGAQQDRLLFKFELGLFAAADLFLQFIQQNNLFILNFFALGNLLIQLGNVLFQLFIEFEIPLAHHFQFTDQSGQALAGFLQLFNHHRHKIDRPRRDQQAEEDRAHQVNALYFPLKQHGDSNLHHHRQHHQSRCQQ